MRDVEPWMVRDDPSYDPNRIGAVSLAKVIAALAETGKPVFLPCVNVCCYDLVFEEEGRFFRVQCKTGRIFRGAVAFRSHRLRAARRETGWVRSASDYNGKVDHFGIYCPDNDSVYLVPIGVVGKRKVCYLRLVPARNNQNKRTHRAADYLLGRLRVKDGVVNVNSLE